MCCIALLLQNIALVHEIYRIPTVEMEVRAGPKAINEEREKNRSADGGDHGGQTVASVTNRSIQTVVQTRVRQGHHDENDDIDMWKKNVRLKASTISLADALNQLAAMDEHLSVFESDLRSEVQRVLAEHRASTEEKYLSSGMCATDLTGRREYTHRKPRAHELRSLELYDTVAQEADGFAHLKHFALPPIVYPAPVVLDEASLDVSRRFGRWGTNFEPNTTNLLAFIQKQAEETELPSPQVAGSQAPPFVALFRDAITFAWSPVSCAGVMYGAGGCLWDTGGLRAAVMNRHEGLLLGAAPGAAVYPPRIEGSKTNQSDLNPHSKHDPNALLKLAQQHKTKRIDHTESLVIPFCDAWCRGYYHFTHEHLPRLALIYSLLPYVDNQNSKNVNATGFRQMAIKQGWSTSQSQNVMVIISMHRSFKTSSFMKQFMLDILGIPRNVIKTGHTIYHSPVVVYPQPMRCGNTFMSALHMLRNIVFGRLNLESRLATVTPDRAIPLHIRILWAERPDGSRTPRNWDVLKESIAQLYVNPKNYAATRGDEISANNTVSVQVLFNTHKGRGHASQQVTQFNKADVVIGPHGANLANVMFMKAGAHLIEIASLHDGNMCYYTTSSRCGVVHHLVPHDQHKASTSFTIAVPILVRHLEHAIQHIVAYKLRTKP